MHIDLITIFPEMIEPLCAHGIVARARERDLWSLRCWNPRDFTTDGYRRVDDRPYGGGPGMVMIPGPLTDALSAIGDARKATGLPASAAPVLCLTPQGRPADHALIRDLSALPALTLLAGRYEGIDQRFIDAHVDLEVSVGDIVVSGGELPAMMLIDAIVRLLPGALNDPDSAEEDSFAHGLLEGPQYTRPEVFGGRSVPEVLRGGDHARIARWRREQALARTLARRPDLIEAARARGRLDTLDEAFLATLGDRPSE